MSTEPESTSLPIDSPAPAEVTSEAQVAEAEEVDKPLEPYEMDRHECLVCGYIYEPVKGDDRENISSGTPFEELPSKWRCPVCGAGPRKFKSVGPAGPPSGFSENLGYGLGVNAMTPGQKNILIFGSLMVAILFFLSLYGCNGHYYSYWLHHHCCSVGFHP